MCAWDGFYNEDRPKNGDRPAQSRARMARWGEQP